MTNPHKTISAGQNGIVISFRDVNKHLYVPYPLMPEIQTLQLQGRKTFQVTETPFNAVQLRLYNEMTAGFNAYSAEEIAQMTDKQKHNVAKRYNRVRLSISILKQEVIYKEVDDILATLFPKSRLVQHMVCCKETDRRYKDDEFTLEELGITPVQVAHRLVKDKLLPENFFQLSETA